jgi:hypothetical protein
VGLRRMRLGGVRDRLVLLELLEDAEGQYSVCIVERGVARLRGRPRSSSSSTCTDGVAERDDTVEAVRANISVCSVMRDRCVGMNGDAVCCPPPLWEVGRVGGSTITNGTGEVGFGVWIDVSGDR